MGVRLSDDGSDAIAASVVDVGPALGADAHQREPDLRQVDEWFDQCFRHAPVAMALIRPDGHYCHVNAAMSALTGYTDGELVQLGVADIIHPDDVGEAVAAVASLVAGERDSVVLETRYISKSGDCTWAAESATLMRRSDGSPHYVVSQLNDISAAKQSQRDLFEEHRRLGRAEFMGRVGSGELDLTTDLLTWSPGLSRLMGRSRSGAASDLSAAMANIHGDDVNAVRAALQTCGRTGEPQRLRFRINRMDDGVARWLDARAEAVYEDGRVVRIVGVVADVTERVEAEQAIVSARSFQQAVITASPDIIYVWDLVSQSAVWSNRSVFEELGYTDAQAQDMSGDPAGRLVPADARAEYDAAMITARDALTDEAARLDLPMLAPDGTRRWYSRRIAPLHRDEHGAVTQVVGVLRDTTNAMAVQDALRDSEAKFRQLADNIDVAFTLRTWDPDAFVYVSPGYEKIFGYDPMMVSEPPTQSLKRIHAEDRARFMTDYWAVCRAGKPVQAEYRIERPDGEMRWVRARNSPVKANEGEPRRSAAIITDITESRRAEAALAAAQRAESASAAKNEFLGRMSHELRTPMNAILGFAQLLELDATPGPEQDAVQHILRGGRHLVSLIDDVLDIASIEVDRLELNVARFSVAELLVETTALMSPLAAAARVELVYRPDGGAEHWVRADSRRLRQVLLNLLSNAIKYNVANGRVEVHCEVVSTAPDANPSGDEGADRLDIVVSDTGRGIQAEDLPRLFVPFDRLGVQETGIEGTGVGLALSLRLMSMMGGDLRATSQYGVGSTFIASIALPDRRERRAEHTAESAVPYPASARAVELAPRNLLYIEDVMSNVDLMQSLIERRPRWRMVVAGSGRLGQQLAATAEPDLVLLDVDLPDLSGHDVLRGLRADPVTRALPVVILSADANPHQIDRLIAAGADGCLTKPIAVADILGLLETYDPSGADGSSSSPARAAPTQQ